MAACILASAHTHCSIRPTHSLKTWTDGGGILVFSFQKTYPPAIEQLLRQYSQSLSEKDRRRFAAVEAITLGHGGIRSIANVLGCDPHTVKEGMRELKQLPADPTEHRVRKPGGGRKKTEEKHPDVIEQVQDAKYFTKSNFTFPCSVSTDYQEGAMKKLMLKYLSKIGLQATPCVRPFGGQMRPPKRFPTVCKPKLSVLAPASYDAFSRGLALPGGRLPRGCPAATRRIAASSFAIWPRSFKRFSRRATRS